MNEQARKALELAREALQRGDTYDREYAVAAIDAALSAHAAPVAQGDTDLPAWIDLQREAEGVVRSKALWKRFIDGTPLANDISCWMADFAQQHATPAAPVAQGIAAGRIAQPYTLAEIRERIASHDYSAELLLQHAMLLLDKSSQPVSVQPLTKSQVMTALAMCPTDMSHPQKCEWIAQALNGIGQGGA